MAERTHNPGRLRRLVTLAGFSRPMRWAIAVCLVLAVGLAALLVRISNAASYLSDDPKTCMNCHVMTNAYATWQRGSHGHVAVCNDCHVPHDSLLAQYAFKAQDGTRHSYVFTLRKEPQVLTLNPGAVPVVQANCIRCHADQTIMIRAYGDVGRNCWDCHNNIHGDVISLSASPYVRRPQLPSAGLDWMKGKD